MLAPSVFIITSIVIATSTSADLTPVQCIFMANVCISCGISPVRDTLTCGVGSTDGFDVVMLMRYGSGLPIRLCHVNAIESELAGTTTLYCSA